MEKQQTYFLLVYLFFKLQQEVLKPNDIWVSWNSPKLTWRRIFNLENRSSEIVSFPQKELYK